MTNETVGVPKVQIPDEGAEGVATADSTLAKGISTLGGNLVSNWSPRPTDLSHQEFLAV
jgi:hypothetical protein